METNNKPVVVSDKTYNGIINAVANDAIDKTYRFSYAAVLSSVDKYTDNRTGKDAAKVSLLSLVDGKEVMSLKTNLPSFIEKTEKAIAEKRIFGALTLEVYPKGHDFKGDGKNKTEHAMARIVDFIGFDHESYKAMKELQLA